MKNKELSTAEKLLWLVNKEWGIHPLYQCVYYQYYDVTDDGLTRFYYGARNEKTFKEAINIAYYWAVKESK